LSLLNFLKDSKPNSAFEDKEWTFVIEDVSELMNSKVKHLVIKTNNWYGNKAGCLAVRRHGKAAFLKGHCHTI